MKAQLLSLFPKGCRLGAALSCIVANVTSRECIGRALACRNPASNSSSTCSSLEMSEFSLVKQVNSSNSNSDVAGLSASTLDTVHSALTSGSVLHSSAAALCSGGTPECMPLL